MTAAAPQAGAPARLDEEELGAISSLDAFEPLAEARMEPSVFGYVRGWAGSGRTTRENRAAHARWGFVTRALSRPAEVDLSTTVLGRPVDLPLLFAPTAVQGLAHPDGEVAVARAARRLGTVQVLSCGASRLLEEVAGVGQRRWFQLYWFTDQGLTRELVERATAAGFEAIVLTVDSAGPFWREGEARLPLALPPNAQPNLPDRDLSYEPTLTWRSLDWLRSISPLPILLKGVVHPDDVRAAAGAGVPAVIVSNHGGRQIDGCIPTLEALPRVADAAGDAVELYVDGGIRTGSDVMRALALGARAALIGRPLAWGLAVGGEAGVARVVDIVAGELAGVMASCGCDSIGAVGSDAIRRLPEPLAGTTESSGGRPGPP